MALGSRSVIRRIDELKKRFRHDATTDTWIATGDRRTFILLLSDAKEDDPHLDRPRPTHERDVLPAIPYFELVGNRLVMHTYTNAPPANPSEEGFERALSQDSDVSWDWYVNTTTETGARRVRGSTAPNRLVSYEVRDPHSLLMIIGDEMRAGHRDWL